MKLLVSNEPNNFDTIRIAMALLVVWSHSFALYFGTEASEPLSLLTAGVANAGNVAVDVFFIVSGFLILKSFERSSSHWDFLKKRIARIVPGFMVATSVCAFVLLPALAGTHYTVGNVLKTLSMNLLLQGWFVDPNPFVHNPVQSINGSLWSIPYEFWCYLGVLAYGMVKGGKALLVSVFIVVIGLDVWTTATGKQWGGGILTQVVGWPNFWFRMAPCFMAGMIAYRCRDLIPRSGWIVLISLVLLIVCARFAPLTARALLPVILAYSVFYYAFSRQFWQAAKYGDFSYGTYLYAFPIQQLILVIAVGSFPMFIGTSLVLSGLAGIASWFAVERWFHRAREPIATRPQGLLQANESRGARSAVADRIP
jgi:peptidoglycan/LPS O-acetylase OafA/YrhL